VKPNSTDYSDLKQLPPKVKAVARLRARQLLDQKHGQPKPQPSPPSASPAQTMKK
jgi:hypothetical protein